jgi:hypothetical protein
MDKLWGLIMSNISDGTVRSTVRFAAALVTLGVSSLALGAATLLTSTPANAYGTHHAFCIQGNEFPGLSACTFDTYAQCLATASGRNLVCIANPYFAGASDDPYAYQNRAHPFPPNAYWYR